MCVLLSTVKDCEALGLVSCTGIYNKPRVHGVGLATVAASLNDSLNTAKQVKLTIRVCFTRRRRDLQKRENLSVCLLGTCSRVY